MSEELKCCPFCGGEAYIVQLGNQHTLSRGYEVGCKKCRVNITNRALNLSLEWARDTSIKAWNTRAIEANCQEKLDSSVGDKTSPTEEEYFRGKLYNARFYQNPEPHAGELCGLEHYTDVKWVYKGNVYKHAQFDLTGQGVVAEESCLLDKESFLKNDNNKMVKDGDLIKPEGGKFPMPEGTGWRKYKEDRYKNIPEPIIDPLPMEKLIAAQIHVDRLAGIKLDPKEHPLTPDMVGRVVLVDGRGDRTLMQEWVETEMEQVNWCFNAKGRDLVSDDDDNSGNIKYYYFI